jgi:asparaginyl-tRNA synthetase
MRLNDDQATVAATDLLVPRIGEMIGGSQREERLEVLERLIREHDVDDESIWWYKELRRWGTTPHGGFGLGFERMLMWMTGMQNIRDVLFFLWTTGSAEF